MKMKTVRLILCGMGMIESHTCQPTKAFPNTESNFVTNTSASTTATSAFKRNPSGFHGDVSCLKFRKHLIFTVPPMAVNVRDFFVLICELNFREDIDDLNFVDRFVS